MQFSQKSKEHIDSCRFCWMCHHVCPIGNATGLERNTARARALGLSLVMRDAIEYSDDIIKNVYECSLCGGCMTDCVTGWDPVMFTKEARLHAALEGKLPEYVEKMIENIEATGNIYGIKDVDKALADAIAKHSAKADTLLFLGKDATFKSPANAVNAIKVLEKAGVEFTVLADEPDSGYAMEFLVGAAEETRQIAINTAKALDYKTVVCYDPCDAKMFLREYKEWGVDLKADVVTFTTFLAKLIADGKLAVKNTGKAYTFNDPVHLARDLEETEAARNILAACGENREMLLNGKYTMLAGNLVMNEYMPKVMADVATNRWINAKNMNAETVVTASVADYEMLKATKPENIDLKTIEEVVLGC